MGGIAGIAKSLKTNLRNGISESDIDLRIDAFGKNDPVAALRKSLWMMIAGNIVLYTLKVRNIELINIFNKIS